MRICIDLDGTICNLRASGESYADVVPLPGAVDKLRALRQAGHTLILHTARHMMTTNGNLGLVMARQGQTLFEWLARHELVFDEVYMGKPQADVYIDDNALRFDGDWRAIEGDGSNLPCSSERRIAKL